MHNANPDFSPLDSNRFQTYIGKINADEKTRIESVFQSAKADGIEMLIVRVPSRLISQIHEIERFGGKLCDSLVVYDRVLDRDEFFDANVVFPADCVLSMTSDRDLSDITRLAVDIFKDYDGHYHADPKLADNAACEAYVDWARKLAVCHDDNNTSFVIRSNQSLCAFGSVKKINSNTADCPLYFISEKFRGIGLFKILLRKSMNWAYQRDCTRIEYSTQLNNLGAQRGIGGEGFRIARSYHTFHCWL